MIVYRICKTYPPDHDPLDGIGAFKKGGRWNSKGTKAVYTASSLALARSELARHINLESIPDEYRVYEIEIPNKPHDEVDPLPEDWDDDPPSPASQHLGSDLLENSEAIAIKVRSVCDPNGFIFILNPLSIHFKKVKIVRDYLFIP